jgi:CDP-diglyceride synthetase
MILPSLLIIANDVFAYIFGFFFGRRFFQRGLIELSPKKTWEGFIGATIVTFGFGFVLSRLFGSFAMFVCPKTDFTFGFADCVIEPHFIPADYALPMVLQSAFKLIGLSFTSISVSPIQIHGNCFLFLFYFFVIIIICSSCVVLRFVEVWFHDNIFYINLFPLIQAWCLRRSPPSSPRSAASSRPASSEPSKSKISVTRFPVTVE